jgi:hypothetical protein
MTNFLKETIPTYLPSYCQGPSVKAKDLTTKSVVKGKGKGREGKGRGHVVVMNVEEITKE